MFATEQAYRKTASEGASGLSLLVALYDTLAGDLRRAAEAERCNNIEKRCAEVKHALLVVAHLEDWIHRGSGGELADRLKAFYASLRRDMIVAQAKRSPELLERQMESVLKVRKIWHDLDSRRAPSSEIPAWAHSQSLPSMPSQSYASSWSA
jgi:flagellar protein FliS